MAVKVDLLPSYSLGRYFQLAAIAFFKPMPVGDSLVFDQATEYAQLVRLVLEKAIELKTGAKISVDPGRLCEVVNLIRDNVPEPRFKYNASIDTAFVTKLRLSEVSECELSPSSLSQLVALYVSRLLEDGVSSENAKLPMLLRSTIFGKVRGPRTVEVEVASVDSIGLALLGALASFLGAVRIANSWYEYYIIPDGSYESLRHFTPVVEVVGGALGRAQYSIPEVSRVLANVGGLGLDLASYLAALVNVLRSAETAERALALAGSRAFETLMLVRLESGGQRPNVTWVGSLAVSDPLVELSKRRLETAVGLLYRVAREVERRGTQKTKAVVSACVRSVAMAALTSVTESARVSYLLACARSLASLLDDDVSEEVKASIRLMLEHMGRG